MNKTINFGQWLDAIDIDGHTNDVFDLHESIERSNNFGRFEIIPINVTPRKCFLKCGGNEELLFIASEKARAHLLKMINNRYCPAENTIFHWCEFNRNMQKDN